MLEAGIKGEQSVEVVYENTATAVGSGVLEVFGTPCMLALMEKTASESVAPYLEEGCGSVGTQVTISHVAATPIGMTVRCETELTEVDGRRLVFKVAAACCSDILHNSRKNSFLHCCSCYMHCLP